MTELITLPNGLTVEAPNRGEAAFLYEEIFNGDAYLQHGIDVPDGATVFDVGANIGLFAAALAQRRRNLKLHLFEPVPSTFAIGKLRGKTRPVACDHGYRGEHQGHRIVRPDRGRPARGSSSTGTSRQAAGMPNR
jgi:hypothetical protein